MQLTVAALSLALVACVPVPHRAAVRARAEGQLTACLRHTRGWQALRARCVADTQSFCLASGLEKSCGSDGYFTQQRR